MPGEKFLQHNGVGGFNEVEAVQAGGAGSADRIPSLDSNGRLPDTMLPTGIGADTAMIASSEDLAAGDFVDVYNNAGTANVRKADATTSGKPAVGFVKAATVSGASATVFFSGINDSVTGQTPGAAFLGTTAGAAASTAPSASNNIVQRIGIALSATEIAFAPMTGVRLV